MTHCVVIDTPSRRPLAARRPCGSHPLQRDIIGDRPVGDDDAGGMRAGVAVGAFELAGDVDQFADLSDRCRTPA